MRSKCLHYGWLIGELGLRLIFVPDDLACPFASEHPNSEDHL